MVNVYYRPGREHSYMKAPGGLRYSLGTKDGLSKQYVWHKGNDHVVEMTDADAKVMEEHNKAGRLPMPEERDFMTNESRGTIPAFIIGDAAAKTQADAFAKMYDAYAKAADELAKINSDEIFV